MMKHLTQRFAWLLGTAVVVAGSVGCGDKTGDVSGTVSFDGKILPSGRISFLCEGGDKPVLMSSITDGTYTIEAAPIGRAQVTVETFEITSVAVPNMIASPLPPDQQNEASPTAEFVRIPTRYRSPASSELSHDIVSGQQNCDFDLTSE